MKLHNLNLILISFLLSLFLVSPKVVLASASSCDDHLSSDSFREYVYVLNTQLSKLSSKGCAVEVHCDSQSRQSGVVILALSGNCDSKIVNEKTIKSAVDNSCKSVVKRTEKTMKCVSGQIFEDDFIF